MALTTTQVQQVFLAITGRPAEGQAVAWGANSLSIADLANSVIDIRKGADFANNKDTFIENLYQNLLGRASDAEGKEFWLNALNDGASYGDVVAQFITAVLVQSQTADLYTLQNKLGVAEKISAQVATFEGGAAAEAQLKNIMSNVNSNTTIESIQDSVDNFVGNSVNIKTVTINPADTDPAKIEGSAENATVFNLSLDVASENSSMQQELKGSTKFADTLNVKVTSSNKETESTLTSNNLGTISNIQTLNITTDATIETTNLAIPAGVKNLSFTGKSNDTVNVTAAMTSLNTGGGNDKITLGAKVNSVNAGAGNDIITVNAAAKDVAMSIDGGNGENTIVLNGDDETTNFAKVSFSNIKTLAGKGIVAKSSLDNKTITIGGNNASDAYTKGELTVKAVDGINLSQVTALETKNDSTIAITDVKSGTVKLNKDDGIAETITLAANANKVAITGFVDTTNATSDKINFTSALGATDFAGTGNASKALEAAPATAVGVANKKAYVLNYTGNKDVSKLLLTDLDTALGKGTGASTKALIAVTKNDDDKDLTAFYLVDASAAAITGVKLLATIDQDVQAGDTFQNSTFGGAQ